MCNPHGRNLNPLIAMDTEDELSERGFDPSCAATVPDAQNILEQHAPEFANLDMHLRSGTSFDLARVLRTKGVPFACDSGNDASSLPEDLRSSNILTKLINFDDLVKLIADTGKRS